MPMLTRYYIKASFIHLLLGLLLGVLLALPTAADVLFAALRPVYLHLIILGWVGQLIIGVMYWMFPKYSPTQPRGNQRLGWAVFVALNGGLLLRAIGEALLSLAPESASGWLLAVSAVLLFAAGWGVVANTWQRVRER